MDTHSQSQYDSLGSGLPTFGLEPLGYSEAVSRLPPMPVDVPQTGSGAYPTRSGLDSTLSQAPEGFGGDGALDFDPFDAETLAMWTSVQTSPG